MIKDCIYNLSNTPEELKEIIRNGTHYTIIFRQRVSCNCVNGKYINIVGIYDIIRELSPPNSFMTYGYPYLHDSLIINNELKLF